MKRTLGILTLALALSLPAAAEAQHPQTRQGFGISFGLGAGSAGFCDDCDELGGTEFSGYLRLGGYLTPSVFLAGESNGWVGGSDTFDALTLGAIMAVVQWYPMSDQGLYLKGGLGYSYADPTTEISTSGFAGSAGAGAEPSSVSRSAVNDASGKPGREIPFSSGNGWGKDYADPVGCRKFNNLVSRVFALLFRSDRRACVLRLRAVGCEAFAAEMAATGRHSIRRG